MSNKNTVLVLVHGWCGGSWVWKDSIKCGLAFDHIVADFHTDTVEGWALELLDLIDTQNNKQVILVGHSLGGPVIAKAAALSPTQIDALIGIETWINLNKATTEEKVSHEAEVFRKDFNGALKDAFESRWAGPTTSKAVEKIVLSEMHQENVEQAISMIYDYRLNYSKTKKNLESLSIPKIAINWSDTDIDAAKSVGIRVMQKSGLGHFPMLEEPLQFNDFLSEAVLSLS